MSASKDYPLSVVIRAVDQITGPLRAITDKLKGLTTANGKLGKNFKEFADVSGLTKFGSAFQGIGGAVKNVAGETVALGAKLFAMTAAATFAFISIVRGAVEAGDELDKMAKRVGVSVDYYASLAYAANQADISQEEFNGGMDKFSKALGEAKANGGPLLDFLKKVSPRLAEQVKGSKSAEEGLSLMTDAFVRLQDPQKRAALATAAFGRSGAQFGEFLHRGSGSIQQQQLAYLKLAGSQEGFASSSGELENALRDTRTAFEGVRSAIGAGLFPAFASLTDAVTNFIVDNREGLASWARDTGHAIEDWVKGGGMERLITNLKDLAREGMAFIDSIGGMKTIAIAAGAVLAGPLLAAFVGLVPAVVALGVALLTTPFGWFVLAAGAVAAIGITIYKNWDEVKSFFEEFFPGITDDAKNLVTVFSEIVSLAKEISSLNDKWKHSGFKYGDNGWEWKTDLADAKPQQDQPSSFADAAQTVKSLWNYRPGQALGPTGPGAAAAAKVQVSVDFKNTPKGTRVTQSSDDGTDVDLSAGYAHATP